MIELVLFLLALIIPIIAEVSVKGNYNKYSKAANSSKISGQEVARKILDKNGLQDVYVVEVKGYLNDHYDPRRKVVRLSTAVFNGTSIASMAIAAHECGHAIQDKEGYTFLKVRSAIFPVINFITTASYYILLIGILLQILDLLYFAIISAIAGLIFQLVTLPVEFDASKRAKNILPTVVSYPSEEEEGVAKMLTSAALTYVAGVVSSLLNLLRILLMFRRND